jgi:hypothetical protein
LKNIIFISLLFVLAVALCFAANSNWTFNSDIEGWNTPPTTWNSTLAHNGTEGHDAAGSIYVTDSDIWYGLRNTVSIGAANPSYTIIAWAKLISTAPGVNGGLNLSTYNLDSGGDPAVAFDANTTDTWQMQTITGTALTGGLGYIMINAGPWGGTDPATVEFYIDDVSYTEGSSVTDWALFKE